MGDHTEKNVRFYITKIGHYDLILGKPWLSQHNPHVDWEKNTVTFKSKYCRSHCLPSSTFQCSTQGLLPSPPLLATPPPETSLSTAHTENQPRKPRRTSAEEFIRIANQTNTEIFYASVAEICEALDEPVPEIIAPESPVTVDISTILTNHASGSRAPRTFLSDRALDYRRMEESLAPRDVAVSGPRNEALKQKATSLCAAGASLEDIEKALAPKTHVDPAAKLPERYHEFLPIFDVRQANQLPEHRDCDHRIDLLPGKIPQASRAYPMSTDELRVLRKYITEELEKGYIRPSTSPAASPVLFAKKPGGGLRFCVDYRALNAITIKNRYPLPLIQETLAQLSSAKFYTKLDVVSAFNKVRIAQGHEWMTAFMTRYGLYESLVMPFGLTNAPATFQTYINKVLHPYLDVFCTAYIDDILIFSDSLEEHREHVRKVLLALQKAGLHLDIKKCEFEVKEVIYLGMIISDTGVKMDPAKIECILTWETPRSVKDIQGFLGFANFYRRFIKGFSRIVRPLVSLTKKGVKFTWSRNCERAFQDLKIAFTSAPILRHFDPTKEIFVETDASDFVSSGILSQKDDNGVLHPVAFLSKKHSESECNYEIYDKELLAIIRCFEDWRPELEGAAHPITVLTDHRNLEYFMTTKQLSRRQVRWSEFLSQFQFQIRHRPGKKSGKPDALTRRSQDLPHSEDDSRLQHQNQTLLKPYHLPDISFATDLVAAPAMLNEEEDEPIEVKITRLLEEGYATELQQENSTWSRCYMELTKPEGIPRLPDISLSECKVEGNRLYFRDRLYVPDNGLRPLLLQLAHDLPESGHPGKNKLYDLLAREYWWPHISGDVNTFTRNCHGCIRNKTSRLRYQGALKPLPIPAQRWRNISVDFIGPLVPSNGYDTIMVVVDRLSKMRHIIGVHSQMTASELAKLFTKEVWKHHGLPDSIVSDRGSLFVAELWKAICHRLRISNDLSTSFHPETDGQTENANAVLEQYLRHYVDYTQEDWEDWLPLAEYAANNAVSSSTGVSPFFANKGFHPKMSFGPPRPISSSASTYLREQNSQANDFVQKMEEILDILRTNLRAAQAKYEASANANRSAAPAYRVGDQVFLDSRNITTDRPMKKLDNKWLGPFQIVKAWSHHYELDLPFEMQKLHPKFHTNLLRPAPTDPLPGQVNPPPPPIGIDENGEKLWAIDAILDSRREGSKFEYLVLWRGYEGETSWEPLYTMYTARGSTSEFHKRYPDKPTPTKTELNKAKKEAGRDAAAARREAQKARQDSENQRRRQARKREKRRT